MFTNKHVIIAGGTSGINLGIASGFAQANANVSVFSRSRDKVDAVARLGELGTVGQQRHRFRGAQRQRTAAARRGIARRNLIAG